jgi:hypothetical protein
MKIRIVRTAFLIMTLGVAGLFYSCDRESGNVMRLYVYNNSDSTAHVFGMDGSDTTKSLLLPKDSTALIGSSYVVGGGDMIFFENSDTAYVYLGDSLLMKCFFDSASTGRNILRTSDYQSKQVDEEYTKTFPLLL